MSNFDSLDETFDIVPQESMPKPIKRKKVDLVISDKSQDKEKDYQYARAQIYDLVEKMQEAVNGALEVAQESDHPRAYEVCLNGAKNAAEVVEKLGDLHKKMSDIENDEVKVQATQNNTTNNVFMSGSTAELMKMLKDNNK
jgi:23S rRNA U2552 (ribose-2'-O)-methylase RlmE/FtsJ